MSVNEEENSLEDDLKVCCGPTTDVLEHFRTTLGLLAKRGDAAGTKDGSYEHITGLIDDHLGLTSRQEVGYVYLYMLDSLGLIEHGCGIRGSWLTPEGRVMLSRLERWAAARSAPGA